MNSLTCVIIGGGHAGLRALKSIQGALRGRAKKRPVRFILIDKQPAHQRKVLLFRPAVGDESIAVPWTRWLTDGVEFVQGTVTFVDSGKKRIRYTDAEGHEAALQYDLLIVAVGSVVRRPDPAQGGIALTDAEAAAEIRNRWRANLRRAAAESNPQERKRLMAAVVAGAGISGMETSAELALAMRKEAAALGLDPNEVSVYLLNAQDQLFQGESVKAGQKLNQILSECGVKVLHNRKAVREEAGMTLLDNGGALPAGLCIWTIGLVPNPALRSMGLPLTPEGQIRVDECYRVQGAAGVYSIGDCANIVDPATGKADQMTCKEGSFQAMRLAKIIAADLSGRPAPVHKPVMNYFCIGMGPDRGLIWARKWGLEITLTGKLAWKIKQWTWDLASVL